MGINFFICEVRFAIRYLSLSTCHSSSDCADHPDLERKSPIENHNRR